MYSSLAFPNPSPLLWTTVLAERKVVNAHLAHDLVALR
jgi:hypothetical protein